VNTAHQPRAHAAHRAADKTGGKGADDACVDDRSLERKARIRAADGEQTEDEPQKELIVDRALLPLDHQAQRAQLCQHRCHQHEQADVQDERKEQIVLHRLRPFAVKNLYVYSIAAPFSHFKSGNLK